MSHNHQHTNNTSGNIKIAFFLNLSFTVIEIIGGLMTNSLAILSDALHDLGDSFSLGLSWYLDKYSKKGRDSKYSYGYKRYSLMAALISALVLLGGSLLIITQAIPRILHPEHSNAKGMILFAILGIGINGFAALKMKGGNSLNARMVMLHLLEDVLGWVAVLVVAVVMFFKDIPVLDPILSVLITLYVLYNVVLNLKKTMSIFLQAIPENVNVKAIEYSIKEIENVTNVHHTHIWSLDGEHHILTTHVVVKEIVSKEEIIGIKAKCKKRLSLMHFVHITIEIEFENEKCEVSQNRGNDNE